ncbi:NAD(P)/FAD-dependent oxidoreductase [Roseisalinus antarcticus]|uniref:D-amino acid dehydrogenase small subunit n=1 Tax=Roseisalinus antarcticus TaxID=254357 RepID=A0A1Y5TMK0_9RHOB|nr:FAD-binding oxidoreductase [Roseisalinus antarcticus]SLN65472.1 D-amino acid dehydrogenase small subunit [Roseisalinus antarcticus]
MTHQDFDLVVIGAGIVGMSSALWAQKQGLRVAICDPNPPGSGTTYGSACTLATYACIPVNSPSLFADLPRLLFSQDSPLGFNLWHGLTHPRWMLSFLNNCRPGRVRHISRALGRILSHADAGLNPLIAEAGAEDLMVANDCLNIWSTRAGFEAERASNAMRRLQGVAFDELSPDEVRQAEPNLRLTVHAGLRFRGARHVIDPMALVTRMQARVEALGGTYLAQEVTECRPDEDGVTVRLPDGTSLRAGHVAVTAGARSARIAGTGAEALPLGTERGYHLIYRDHGALISRPVGWAEGGFYATPMAQGLRIAGTVEIDSVDAPFNAARTEYLRRRSAEMFGDLGAPDDTWLGHRPTMPDSLPVIGPSAASPRMILAFGHQHIGLTLGGITGRIVADMAQGRAPNFDIADFSPRRFA